MAILKIQGTLNIIFHLMIFLRIIFKHVCDVQGVQKQPDQTSTGYYTARNKRDSLYNVLSRLIFCQSM